MRSPRAKYGFTLVEMLVSIAVLVVLMVLITELFDSATATATMSRTHIDTDEAARVVLDRIGSDLASMVRRADVNYIFYKNSGGGEGASSDAMFFYSEGPGYLDPEAVTTSGSASTMAVVGYRINENSGFYPGVPVLERLGEDLTWGGAPDASGTNPGGMVYLPSPVSQLFSIQGKWYPTLAGNWSYTLGTPPYAPQSDQYDTSHYQVLSDMVFRMELCFLLKSGTYAISGTTVATGTTGYSNAPTAIPPTVAQPYITKHYFADGVQPDLPGNVYGLPPDLGGIVVTIAVLDSASRSMISGGGVSKLASVLNNSLPAAQPTGSTPSPGNTTLGAVEPNPEPTSQIWESQLEQSGLAQTVGIPATALQQVRVYERTFYLDEN